jgi:hypothetical protein
MRWERVTLPFPILRGVKMADERPLGASSLESMPFPGRAASSAEMGGRILVIEPILEWVNERGQELKPLQFRNMGKSREQRRTEDRPRNPIRQLPLSRPCHPSFIGQDPDFWDHFQFQLHKAHNGLFKEGLSDIARLTEASPRLIRASYRWEFHGSTPRG